MSLNFSIVPITSDYITDAYNIQTKLTERVKKINIVIDTNYNNGLVTRINKWKKKEYDIITIDQDYAECKSVIVRFSDKGSRPQSMDAEEFIELVASFEEDEDEEEEEDKEEDKEEEKEEEKEEKEETKLVVEEKEGEKEDGCVIM